MCSAQGHVRSRGTVAHVTTQPATPEGHLLRDARTDAGLTARQAAEAIGLSLKQWGEAERGTSGDASSTRRTAPSRSWPEASASPRASSPPPDAPTPPGSWAPSRPGRGPGAPDPHRHRRPDRGVHRTVGRCASGTRWSTCGSGSLTVTGASSPRDERVRAVLGWVREHRPGQDAEQAADTPRCDPASR